MLLVLDVTAELLRTIDNSLALKRIFERLRESGFSRVYRSTLIRIRLLVLRRKEQFDKFVITPRLEEILVD